MTLKEVREFSNRDLLIAFECSAFDSCITQKSSSFLEFSCLELVLSERLGLSEDDLNYVRSHT